MARVAVIIVHWNCWDVLARCLDALAQQTWRDFSVTIVDNASSQPMPAQLLERCPGAVLVQNATNLGFAAANNQAVLQHSGNSEWLALLNPDAFAQPDWLEQLMQASAAAPDCSVFASRQIDATHPELLDGDGDAYHISGRAWRIGHGQPIPQNKPAVEPVFSPCAASGLYRRSAFMQVGGFDEDFFCYFEDVDLGFRLQLAGYHCLLVRTAVVHHLGATSTGGQHSDFALYHGHRNLVWTYFKNMPGALFWLLLPLHLAINFFTLLHHAQHSKVIWRAKRDAFFGLLTIKAKRNAVQCKRTQSIASLWRMMAR
ncbi:MAG: glycosyltransferase family 2 protein [Comamonadaceae bacterium]